MEYIVEGHKYHFSYQEMSNLHDKYCTYTDEEFLANIVEIIHFAAFACFFKEMPTHQCLSDAGILHQLIHLLHIPDEPLTNLQGIRELFEKVLKFA